MIDRYMPVHLRVRVLDEALYPQELEDGFGPAKPGDAGIDLRAREDTIVAPGVTSVIPLGVAVQIPDYAVGWMTGRSSGAKDGQLSLEGKIDSGYRGEIHAFVTSLSGAVHIERGERIAQLVVVLIDSPRNWVTTTEELGNTARGESRFGSTGKH